ncbi:MAG: hypothetical protein ABMA25_07680 [Ilumatobacteraceae bacterium]
MFQGADSDQLRTTATALRAAAEEMTTTFAGFGTTRADFSWTGPDADQYRQRLSVDIDGRARRLAKVLDAVADELTAQARQQDEVSATLEPSVAAIAAGIVGSLGNLFGGDGSSSLLPPAVERTEIWNFGGSGGIGDFLSAHVGKQYKIEYLDDDTVRVTSLVGVGAGLGVGASAGLLIDTGDNTYGQRASLSAEAVAMLQAGDSRVFDSESDALKYLAARQVTSGAESLPIIGGTISDGIGAISHHAIDMGTLESNYAGIDESGSASAALHQIKWPGGGDVAFDHALGVKHYADGSVGVVGHVDAGAAGGYFAGNGDAAVTAQYEVKFGDGQAVLHVQGVTQVNGSMQLMESSVDLTGAPQSVVHAVASGDFGSVSDYLQQHAEVRLSSYDVHDQGMQLDAVVAGVEGTRVVITQQH